MLEDLGNKEIFARNLDNYMKEYRIDRNKLCNDLKVPATTLSDWLNAKKYPRIDNLERLARYFHIKKSDLTENKYKTLNYDNAEYVDINFNTVKIPVLGTIKAGIPIEAQEDILEYIDIPKEWISGNKSFYGLKVSGDSMYPKYLTDDIVIFEQINDYSIANKKDCAVMVNGFDATFKNVTISETGITLVPLNLNNQDNYQPTFYNKEQVEQLPVKIIGIAREKRTRL